jgi:hypothetical protein
LVVGAAIAHVTASTALANSTRMPSPVALTMRPLCSAMTGDRRGLDERIEGLSNEIVASTRQDAVCGRQHRTDPGNLMKALARLVGSVPGHDQPGMSC